MSDELLVAVLAAGASRRLGRPKQLVELDGEPLIRRVCRTSIAAGIGPVAVVLGCRRDEIAPVVSDLPLTVLVNDAWDEGMASSVRTATLAASTLKVSASLLVHADQYASPATTSCDCATPAGRAVARPASPATASTSARQPSCPQPCSVRCSHWSVTWDRGRSFAVT